MEQKKRDLQQAYQAAEKDGGQLERELAGTNSAEASIMVITICNLLKNVKSSLRNSILAKAVA